MFCINDSPSDILGGICRSSSPDDSTKSPPVHMPPQFDSMLDGEAILNQEWEIPKYSALWRVYVKYGI